MPSRPPTTRSRIARRAASAAARLLDTAGLLAVVALLTLASATLLTAALGDRLAVVAGPSMEPTIGKGSVVVLEPVEAGGHRVGDVVMLRTDSGTLVLHRVVRLASIASVTYLETKGDANRAPDPVLTPASAIVGRVVLAVPLAGYLEVAMRKPLGLAGVAAMLAAAWLGASTLRVVAQTTLPGPS